MEEMKKELETLPGQVMAFSQPIEQRVNEILAGTKGEVAVKVYGDDYEKLAAIVGQIATIPRTSVRKRTSVTNRLSPQPVLEVLPRLTGVGPLQSVGKDGDGLRRGERRDCGRRSVRGRAALPLGDPPRGGVRPAARRFQPNFKYQPGPGKLLPLNRLAEVRLTEKPVTISREWGKRRVAISCNPDTEDVAGFVEEARRRVREQVKLLPGYRVEWGGSFESLQRFQERMWILVPVSLFLIFFLLYLSFGSFLDAGRVFPGRAVRVVGGVAAFVARDLPFSVSAGVGFIALSGVAVLNSLLLVTFHPSVCESAACHCGKRFGRPCWPGCGQC